MMPASQCRKAYVAVNLDVDEDGNLFPRAIRWKDGRIFIIAKLKDTCRATSSKVRGGGIRYTEVVGGQAYFLFTEANKWFVEAKDGCG